MKLFPLLAVAASSLLAGCLSNGSHTHDHWNTEGVAPSMARAFLGYDAEIDGPYVEHQWNKKQALNTLTYRYFFNHNPDNPFQPEIKGYYGPRPTHSILPNPAYYIHFEGLAMGALIYGMGGPYLPIPLDSLIATFSPGGDEEFSRGVDETFSSDDTAQTASTLHGAIGLGVVRADKDM